ncbi:MAG TPA: siderophore-interacting protein [Acidimicrobiales bacterium]|nr:siderophore-interacting protein [Acidimicrobiales bacterium]
MQELSPRMVRVTLGGEGLQGFPTPQPAASVRVLLPEAGEHDPELPTWTGNEFRRADGRRPTIRTFTPRRLDGAALLLDVDVVVHGEEGAASRWARSAEAGSAVALSGPGRGYQIDPEARAFVLIGDETALPAIGQLLEAIPPDRSVRAVVELASPEARLDAPPYRGSDVDWMVRPDHDPPGDRLFEAAAATEVAPDTRLWVAGEAAAVQRVRRLLFHDRQVPRHQATVRGYWKHGRAGDDEADS